MRTAWSPRAVTATGVVGAVTLIETVSVRAAPLASVNVTEKRCTPAAAASKLIACVRADSSGTLGPPVCCQTTLRSGPLQPATTAPAVRPTGTVASATTL